MAKTLQNSFHTEELSCEMAFRELGPVWHLCTPEDFPLVFATDEDFIAGMALIGICAKAFPSVRLLTFEIMSNHLHDTLAGPEDDIKAMFEMRKEYLGKYLKGIRRPNLLKKWSYKLINITDLGYLRNVIAYTNRNGFIVHPETTPYSYLWGANRFMFNPELVELHSLSKDKLTVKEIRQLFRTGLLDSFAGLPKVNGVVTPIGFCDIASAEDAFRNAKQYFFKLSRDVESQKAIASVLGESLFYTDDELYILIKGMAHSEYQVDKPTLLPRDAKINYARKLHSEYNSSNKQISRILGIDISFVDKLFPAGS